jgi:hypothetical protein
MNEQSYGTGYNSHVELFSRKNLTVDMRGNFAVEDQQLF